MTEDNWVAQLEEPGYRWEWREPPVTDADLALLSAFVGRPLPADYVTFLRSTDGAGLWYKDLLYLRLWRAADIPSWSTAYGFTPDEIAGAAPIADNGGGEAVVFDCRPERPDGAYPLYLINFVTIDWGAAIPLTPDFHSLLLRRTDLFGHEEA
jgi:hypothetical protein